MTAKWTIVRSGGTLTVRKNGEAYSKDIPYVEKNPVYRELSDKRKSPFEYWAILAKYHETTHDDKEEWTHE